MTSDYVQEVHPAMGHPAMDLEHPDSEDPLYAFFLLLIGFSDAIGVSCGNQDTRIDGPLS